MDIDYRYWITGKRSEEFERAPPKRTPDPVREWLPLRGTRDDGEYVLRGSTIDSSINSNDHWYLSKVGQGAFRFTAENAGGGLVIALTSWTKMDTHGLYVVLDDDNHESYIMQLSSLGARRLKGRHERQFARVDAEVDSSFRLQPLTRYNFWVIYRRGELSVGVGDVVGEGQLILKAETDAKNLYHFSFARLGTRWANSIRVSGVESMKYNLGPIVPMKLKEIKSAQANAKALSPLYVESPPNGFVSVSKN